MIIYYYFLITIILNLCEIIFYKDDWLRIMNKNKNYISKTLLFTLLINPLSLILSDYYIFQNKHTMDNIYIEIIKFLIGINLFDIFTYIIHYTQHLILYKYHKTHHQIIDICMFFSYYFDTIDLILTSIPYYFLPQLLNLSKYGTYFIICFIIFFSLYEHRLYSHNNNKYFGFHNYHHYNPKKNFATGFPLILLPLDKIFNTNSS